MRCDGRLPVGIDVVAPATGFADSEQKVVAVLHKFDAVGPTKSSSSQPVPTSTHNDE
jgi:hypothetical protein